MGLVLSCCICNDAEISRAGEGVEFWKKVFWSSNQDTASSPNAEYKTNFKYISGDNYASFHC